MTQTIAFAGTPFEGLGSQLAAPGNGGEASGLAGLFSGLVQSSGSPAGFATGLPAAAASKVDSAVVLEGGQSAVTLPVDALAALQALLQQAGLNIQVAQPVAGPVAGTAAAAPAAPEASPLEALAAALQQVQGALGNAGVAPQGLTSHEGLVQALQALGVSSTEADKLAGKIEAALDELKTKLSLNDDQLAVLAQVLLAANVVQGVVPQVVAADGAEPGQPLTFTVENAAPATPPAGNSAAYYSQANAALKNATALPAAGDFAREVAGLGKGQDAPAEDVPSAEAGGTDAPLPDSALPLVAVTVDAAGVSVKNVLKADAPVAAPASVGNANLNAVAAADVLAPAGGEAKFVWRGEDSAVAVEAKAADLKGDKLEASKAEVAAVADTAARADARAELLAQAQGTRPAADASGFAKQVEQHQQRLELAQRFDVAGQAVVQIKNLIDQGGGAVRVRLNPPELGEIYVELLVKDGAVSGRISATDPAVVNALAGDVKQFGDGLRAAGFKLGNDGLTFMLSQNSHQGQQQGQQQQARQEAVGWNDAGPAADEAEPAGAPVTGWVSPDRLLDMNI